MSTMKSVRQEEPMCAYDLAVARWQKLSDALKLAEQAKPYVDGEHWAVEAVHLLRCEVVDALRLAAEKGSEAA
jgi:hypothetical protein